MAKSDGCDYFKRTRTFWVVSVTLSMSFFTCLVFSPQSLPLDFLGVFGTFCSFLVENYSGALYRVWVWAWAIHLLEAVVSLVVCSMKGITSVPSRCLWFLQTFLFGMASLGLLLRFTPQPAKLH